MTKKAMLIPCPVTEDDKYKLQCRLMDDLFATLGARRPIPEDESKEYALARDQYSIAQVYLTAREFVNVCDLAPIEH